MIQITTLEINGKNKIYDIDYNSSVTDFMKMTGYSIRDHIMYCNREKIKIRCNNNKCGKSFTFFDNGITKDARIFVLSTLGGPKIDHYLNEDLIPTDVHLCHDCKNVRVMDTCNVIYPHIIEEYIHTEILLFNKESYGYRLAHESIHEAVKITVNGKMCNIGVGDKDILLLLDNDDTNILVSEIKAKIVIDCSKLRVIASGSSTPLRLFRSDKVMSFDIIIKRLPFCNKNKKQYVFYNRLVEKMVIFSLCARNMGYKFPKHILHIIGMYIY